MNSRFYTKCDTLIGDIYIVSQNQHIIGLHIGEEDFLKEEEAGNSQYAPKDPLLSEAEKQITEYFRGDRKEFDLPLLQQGTDFRQSVWDELSKIPIWGNKKLSKISQKHW